MTGSESVMVFKWVPLRHMGFLVKKKQNNVRVLTLPGRESEGRVERQQGMHFSHSHLPDM